MSEKSLEARAELTVRVVFDEDDMPEGEPAQFVTDAIQQALMESSAFIRARITKGKVMIVPGYLADPLRPSDLSVTPVPGGEFEVRLRRDSRFLCKIGSNHPEVIGNLCDDLNKQAGFDTHNAE